VIAAREALAMTSLRLEAVLTTFMQDAGLIVRRR
jgi:hypothetical protein